ncbi:PRC-barrel domain-containing protein [Nodosilinea nodulosa]|uniref:PRC-barrel domain-containing protein n=1 Tax=Nodosilinea nodulosa TaxID=416001 RepID=UPI0002D46E59|nr:PRC-barrel domain-containing protein [Nodosilinea nodulosa]
MFKGRDLIGKAIVSYDAGEKFDLVKDLIFDQQSNQLLVFLVREGGWLKHAQVLLLSDVQAIGVDAVITSSQGAIANAHRLPTIGPIIHHNTILKGTRILTLDGRDLGVIVDLYFDETNGKVDGHEVLGGLFADPYSGRFFVPAIDTLKIGRDVAFVPTQTAQLMEEQVGGLRGAMQTASGQLQETAQITGDTLHEMGQTASERFQATAQVTGQSLQELGQSANGGLSETVQLTNERLLLGHSANEVAQNLAQPLHGLGRTTSTAMTKAILDPEAQKAFVTGKVSNREVITPTGSLLVLQGQHITHETADAAEALGVLDDLYRAVGGSWAVPPETRAAAAVARVTVEQAEGRRSQHLVRNEAGSILVAPGQIVTPAVIERAKFYHREGLLLQAVGLTAEAALQRRASSAAVVAGDRLQNTSTSFGNQL